MVREKIPPIRTGGKGIFLGLVINKISIAFFYPVRYTVSNRAAQGRFCDMGAKPGFSPGFFIFSKKGVIL